MNESNKISQDLERLKMRSRDLFSELLVKRPVFDFAEAIVEGRADRNETSLDILKECGEINALPLIDVRNELSGTVKEFYVLSVSSLGIDLICEETYDVKIIEFKAIASIDDGLVLLNEMYELLNN